MAKAEISNRLRELRFQHGKMTQQELGELADAVGCSRRTIVLLEQAK